MPLIKVAPGEVLIRSFRRFPTAEPYELESGGVGDFVRFHKQSGLSTFRLKYDGFSANDLYKILLSNPNCRGRLLGSVVCSAFELERLGLQFSNGERNHAAHVSLRCSDCNLSDAQPPSKDPPCRTKGGLVCSLLENEELHRNLVEKFALYEAASIRDSLLVL